MNNKEKIKQEIKRKEGYNYEKSIYTKTQDNYRYMTLTSDKAKEVVLDSVRRIVKVEDAEKWLQHNLTAYQLAMDVALHTYYQAKDDEAKL